MPIAIKLFNIYREIMIMMNLSILPPSIRCNGSHLYVKGSRHRVPIKNLKLNKNFALWVGLLCGDGCISKLRNNDWRIFFVNNDPIVLKNYIDLVKSIFNIDVHVIRRDNKCDVHFSSRVVYEILKNIFQFPIGEKRGKLRVPGVLFKDKKLRRYFLRGAYSTDGKFTVYKGYPRIGIESATKEFLLDITNILMEEGFNPRIYTWKGTTRNPLYGIYLNGSLQTRDFKNKINFIGRKANKLQEFVNS